MRHRNAKNSLDTKIIEQHKLKVNRVQQIKKEGLRETIRTCSPDLKITIS